MGVVGATGGRGSHDAWFPSELPSKRFLAFRRCSSLASTAVTIVWCASMSAMGEMPMPGG